MARYLNKSLASLLQPCTPYNWSTVLLRTQIKFAA